MFNWVWDFLYGISKSIYALIDGLLSCANMLCGIEPIKYEGSETDLLSFLLRNKNVTYGFVTAVIIGAILVVIFGVVSIIKSMTSEKTNMTPAQVFVKVGKVMLTFLFIPVATALFVYLTNVLMQTLYKSTLGGSPDGMGRFLAGVFGNSARLEGIPEDFYLEPGFDYFDNKIVKNYLDLSNYDYFFSWIAGLVILVCLAMALLMFVDRAISLVILFIFCPISLSTAVIDDGQRFKLWRDQFLVKFLTGYGCIIAINIYALIIAAITSSGLVFFENAILNGIMKIAIIVGGAVSMQRIMALVGNLVSQGAGSNEMRDNALAMHQMKGLGMRALGGVGKLLSSPFRATRSAANFVRDSRQYGMGSTIGQRMGFNTDRSYGLMSKTQLAQSRRQMVEREQLRLNNNNHNNHNNPVQNAILGQNGGAGNQQQPPAPNNANQNPNVGNQMVQNAILNNNNNNQNNNNNA